MAISFPSSPTLNQTYVVGTKTWIWNGYAWDLQVANTTPIFIQANAAFDKANTANTNAVSAGTYANAAYVVANTANVNAISAGTYANAAYVVANTANTNAISAGTYANAAYAVANTANTNAISAGTYANAAFAVANTAAAVNTTQNTNITSAATYANAAYSAANSASTYANAAYAQANTATTNAATADQKAVSAGAYANAAFATANSATSNSASAGVYANSAFVTANAGFVQANSGYVHANAAFNQANTANTRAYNAVLKSGDTMTGALSITDSTVSTSKTTGALKVTGGVGVSGNVYANSYYSSNTSYFGLDSAAPLGGATNPVVTMSGSSNNYVQTYIYNPSTGTFASADFVAYPNNGTDSSGWIDVGITSSTFNYSTYAVTGANEGYLFMSAPNASGTSGNLVIATDSTGTYNSIEFYVAGFGQAKGAAKVVIANATTATSNTTGALRVNGGLGVRGNVYADAFYAGNVNITSRVDWPSSGYAPPSFTTRSVGTKVNLYPALSGSLVDYAIGIDGGVLWSSVPAATSDYTFKWYGGETQIASLTGAGKLTAISANITSTNTSTSTTTGALIVSGGVGVAGNLYATAVYDGGVEILTHANAAFDKANSAGTVANAAYDKANSAGAVANTDYTTVSATAGTYGNAFAIPSVTVAANGRITSITTQTFSAATVGDILALSIALG
jgi:hypothetical protein